MTFHEDPGVPADRNEIIRVRHEKLAALREAGRDPFARVSYPVTHHSARIVRDFDALEGQEVSVAGRMLSKRVMGKASFAHVADREGAVQIYVRREAVGEEAYDEFRRMDIGDILGAAGAVFRTHRGEVSVQVRDFTLLSKSLLPLPEKFHGLRDPDLRYRQRYLDLIMNPEVRSLFTTRSRILSILREYLDGRGYLEVETPVLHNAATNAAARPFKTHHNTLDIDMFLRVETELHLKRLIVGGLERVYEIGRIFRNEGMDTRHNPEFTMVEMYQAYADYHDMMELAEGLFAHIAGRITGGTVVTYGGETVDLTPPWRRMTMIEAVRECAGVDFGAFSTDGQARAAARDHGVTVPPDATWGSVLNEFFEEKAEERLLQPTFVTGYPVEVSPLAKRCPGDPRLTERFEFFITRREMGNAFTELNDPIDQRERFVRQARDRRGDGEYQIDEDFITAMEYGMPPTGGMGIGVDRLVMLMTDAPSIRDVLLFPTMKPEPRDGRRDQ